MKDVSFIMYALYFLNFLWKRSYVFRKEVRNQKSIKFSVVYKEMKENKTCFFDVPM